MYTAIELRMLLAEYIQAKNLVNPQDQAYVNAREDNVLVTAIRLDQNQEFVKRDQLLSQLQNQMQAWHEVDVPGKDPILRYETMIVRRVLMSKMLIMALGREP
jgi:translation initiation factor 2D